MKSPELIGFHHGFDRASARGRRGAYPNRAGTSNLSRMTRLTMMGELAASIVHEVNQPLAAMVTNANACLRWLNRESPDLAEAQEAIRRIIRDGNRGSDVIARIRALLRKGRPSNTLLNLNEVIQEIVTLTQAELQGVTLQSNLDDALPAVSADRVQLQQVMLNLVTNAAEAMKSSRVRMLRIQTQLDPNRMALVIIEDSGVGLNPRQINQIFEPFYTTKTEATWPGTFHQPIHHRGAWREGFGPKRELAGERLLS